MTHDQLPLLCICSNSSYSWNETTYIPTANQGIAVGMLLAYCLENYLGPRTSRKLENVLESSSLLYGFLQCCTTMFSLGCYPCTYFAFFVTDYNYVTKSELSSLIIFLLGII